MTLNDALEEVADEASRATAEAWRAEAISTLREIGNRLDYDVQPVIDSATDVSQEGDSYSFTFTHPQASLFEFGSSEHTITPSDPDGVLAFEVDGEQVFAKEVDHPGTEAILFVSKSQQRITEEGLRDSL